MADYTVQITVKEEYQGAWLAACDKYNKQHVTIDAGNSNISFRYDSTGMVPAAKGKYVMVKLLKAFLEMYQLQLDEETRYRPAIEAVPLPSGAIDEAAVS